MTATAQAGSGTTLRSDPDAIREFWRALVQPGDVHEVRIIESRKGPLRFFGTVSGYHDDEDAFVAAVEPITGQDAETVFITLNPVNPDLLSRATNRLQIKAKTTTADTDVTRRRMLLLDVDPQRPAGISATDEERDAALARRDAIRAWLSEQCGWPEPRAITMSGNGGALLYMIDLPNEDAAAQLVSRVLSGIAERFDDEAVKLDTSVANAARITKIAGTIAAKGDHSERRPWRRATAAYRGGAGAVSRDQLEGVAVPAKRDRGFTLGRATNGGERHWTVDELLRLNNLEATKKERAYGTVYALDRCLTSDDHTDGAAFLEFDNGALAYVCHHNRCQDKGWYHLRDHELITIPGSDAGARMSDSATSNGHKGYGASGSSGSATSSGSAPTWPPRQPLPALMPDVPPLPARMLPAALRPWLVDIAARARLPLEMPTIPAVAGLGAVVGRQVGIRPARFDDYLVVPNLWSAIVARSGMMKTYAVDEPLKPLGQLAAAARERYAAGLDALSAKQDRLQAELDALKDALKQAVKAGNDTGAVEAALAAKRGELRQSAVTERRYLTHDATVEKLGELLNRNPRGLLLVRDELAGWLRTLDKPGREGDREFYLEAWNGTGSYTVDRIGRGTLHIGSLTLSIVGGIQPGKLKRYITDALSDGAGADGLLQRLQLLVWPDGLGAWQQPAHWPDKTARERAYAVYQALDTLDPAAIGATVDDGPIPYLRFAPAAQEVYDTWRDDLERRLRSDELAAFPAFESHIAKYRSLMPSLALLFHLVTAVDTHMTGPVSEDATRLAAAWCEYLELHARKVYHAELAGDVAAAHMLAAKIAAGLVVDKQPVRDIYLANWRGLDTADQVYAALAFLATHSWVRVETITTGGRPSKIVRLHPDLRGEANA